MRTIVAAVMLAAVGLASQAGAKCPDEPVMIGNSFLTGEDCHNLPDHELRTFVMGWHAGLMLSPIYGADQECLKPLRLCLEGKTDSQLAAVLRKWLEANPERWHEQCTIAAWVAIGKPCPAR